MYNLAIFASGTGSNGEKIMQCFYKSPVIHVVAVYTNQENAGIREHATNYNIPSYYFQNEYWAQHPEVIVMHLEEKRVDFIILAGFLRLIPNAILNQFSDKVINIHPSLLPAHGGKGMYGMHVHSAVKASGDKESGMTVHLVNGEYDKGRILFQAKTRVEEDDEAIEIQQKVLALEHEWYPKAIAQYIIEEYKP